jgi:ABC-type transport system substrate-binding protein
MIKDRQFETAHMVLDQAYRQLIGLSPEVVLERNPNYREVFYDEHPPAGDARLQAVAAHFKGRRLPMVDRIEVSIIEEAQPRWLSFLNGEQDMIEEVPNEFTESALPNNDLAPNLRKRGILMERYPRADVWSSYFGMENPVVGGYEPQKVALRRAIALAIDVDKEIRLVRRGQAIPAQSPVGPQTWGYDPAFKSEMSEFNRARARALLDLHGYVDRDGDGWRDQPDGSSLVLQYSSQPDQFYRQINQQWQKNMQAIGVRMEFKLAQWPENLKASRAGKLMMWGVGWSASVPDANEFLALGYGPNKGQANHARTLRPAGVQRTVRAANRAAGWPRAGGAGQRSEDADGRLHALQGARAPHLHRLGTALGAGLPPQCLRAGVLAVCGCGCRRHGATDELTGRQ